MGTTSALRLQLRGLLHMLNALHVPHPACPACPDTHSRGLAAGHLVSMDSVGPWPLKQAEGWWQAVQCKKSSGLWRVSCTPDAMCVVCSMLCGAVHNAAHVALQCSTCTMQHMLHYNAALQCSTTMQHMYNAAHVQCSTCCTTIISAQHAHSCHPVHARCCHSVG